MTSDANFEGKGDFTKSVEPTAQENGQMVNNDLPTAQTEGLTIKPSYNGGFKSSDILAFDALGGQQALLTGLSQYWLEDPTKFRKLVEFLQTVPGDIPVDEKVRGVSFQDILNEPASPKKTRIPIPKFLEEVTDSVDRVVWLRAYLQKVFVTFATSENYLHESGEHEATEWLDVHNTFAVMIEQAAWQKLGSAPQQANIPREVPERPFEWEGYAVYKDNPVNCTDMARLQEWVMILQQMDINQVNINTTQREIINEYKEQIASLNELREVNKKLNTRQNEIIAELQKRLPADNAPVAKAFLSLDLSVVVPYKGASEVEILTYALEEYADSRQDQYESEMRSADFDSAFNAFTDAKTARNILTALRDSGVELAEHNYHAATFKGDSEAFRAQKVRDTKHRKFEVEEFLNLHSLGYKEEPEPETEENQPDYFEGLSDSEKALLLDEKKKGALESDLKGIADKMRQQAAVVNAENQQAEPMLDPEYYLDLTDDEKSVMSLLQAKGLTEAELKRWAINFQNKHIPADSANQDSTPPTDQPTPAEVDEKKPEEEKTKPKKVPVFNPNYRGTNQK